MDLFGDHYSAPPLSETEEYMADLSTLGASLVAQLVKNLPATSKTWVRSLGWEVHKSEIFYLNS